MTAENPDTHRQQGSSLPLLWVSMLASASKRFRKFADSCSHRSSNAAAVALNAGSVHAQALNAGSVHAHAV